MYLLSLYLEPVKLMFIHSHAQLCEFKTFKVLMWHRTLSTFLSLSFSYIHTAITEWLDFKVLSQLPFYNIQPVRHFTVTYNFLCAPRPHKDRPICHWKRPKLDSLIEKTLSETSQPERVVYLKCSLVLLKIITSKKASTFWLITSRCLSFRCTCSLFT